jgi:hypothetical protein
MGILHFLSQAAQYPAHLLPMTLKFDGWSSGGIRYRMTFEMRLSGSLRLLVDARDFRQLAGLRF